MLTQMSKRKKSRSAKGCCPDLGAVLDPRFFKALCDPNRVAILIRLAGCSDTSTVSEVASCCSTDMSVVSRHLATLREAGIIEATKSGKQVHYRVCFTDLVGTLRQVADAIEACCPPDQPTSERKQS